MFERLGLVLYWIGIGLAAPVAVVGIAFLFSDAPAASLLFFVSAVLIWGSGRAVLYILAGE